MTQTIGPSPLASVRAKTEAPPVRIAVVGFGYWGPNLARNLAETAGAELAAICDTRPQALGIARRRYPAATCVENYATLLNDTSIDAVAIATPVSSHADLAIRALEAGKHVLVTKPLAPSVREASRIVEAAERAGRVLLVDHTFVYMGAVQKVRNLVEKGELGDLYYFDSVRVNLGLYQQDVNVLWDLAIHDLSIMQTWIGRRPKSVACIAVGHVDSHPEDIAYLTLLYDDNLVAHIHVNWLSPVKVRRILLGGSKKMVQFDDLDPVEKVKVYDRGITRRADVVGSDLVPIVYRREGDIWIPQLDTREALQVETEHFVRCVRDNESPRTGGRMALELVEILETAEQSKRQGGRALPLPGVNL